MEQNQYPQFFADKDNKHVVILLNERDMHRIDIEINEITGKQVFTMTADKYTLEDLRFIRINLLPVTSGISYYRAAIFMIYAAIDELKIARLFDPKI